MSKYTPGKWEAQSHPTKYIELWKVVAPDMTVAIGIMREHDARLMAAAPEMYDLLKVWVTVQAQPTLMYARERARELLASIDGTEETE